ncbi:hypothetical protein B0H19DRAFT_1385387 [Mycena capillaripes]|nr:hypothetical protein B0H19DRAFT_1385387 [Mycena capillaripes]
MLIVSSISSPRWYRVNYRASRRRSAYAITQQSAVSRGIFDRCRRTTNRGIFVREGSFVPVSTRYMNALAPPFPPPVPNSITRRSKRLVLATLHVVLGVWASRPLALFLMDALTPMSRERRIHRAVAVAFPRRRTTARCILETRTLGAQPLGAYALGSHASRSCANGSVTIGLVLRKPAASTSQVMRYPPLPRKSGLESLNERTVTLILSWTMIISVCAHPAVLLSISQYERHELGPSIVAACKGHRSAYVRRSLPRHVYPSRPLPTLAYHLGLCEVGPRSPIPAYGGVPIVADLGLAMSRLLAVEVTSQIRPICSVVTEVYD